MQISSEKIAAKQAVHTKIIVDGILSSMANLPYAIYLCGGQGRDEGSWYLDDLGEPTPYNDYDVAVIADSVIEFSQLQTLRKELSAKIGIKWVDIDFYTPSVIQSLPPTIHNVDLRHASKLIWGDSSYMDKAPCIDPKQIGELDLRVLYSCRIWTLLGSWSGNFRNLEGEDARFFKNQMAKCFLAACDMLLIKHNAYTTSYRKRVQYISNYTKDEDFIKWANWALNEKLYPSDTSLTQSEMKDLYNVAHNAFVDSFKNSMGEKSNLYLNPNNTHLLFDNGIKAIIRQLLSFVLPSFRRLQKSTELFYAQNFVLCAYSDEDINESYVKKASDILKKWGYGSFETWEDIHQPVANARNNL